MARALSNPVLLASPEKGVDGRTTLARARAPSITDGRIGDFWIDTTTDEQRLYGPKTAAGWPDLGLIKGNRGWSPSFAVVADGARRVQQVVDWQGGEGTKPAAGQYVGAAGFVTSVADAVDVRGPEGPEMLIGELADASVDITDDTLSPSAQPGGDNFKRQAVEVFDLGGTLPRKSIAHAQASTVRKNVGSIIVGGYLYNRAPSEPSSSAKFRTIDRWTDAGNSDSANGGWWGLVADVDLPRLSDSAASAVLTPFFRNSFKKRVRFETAIRPASYAAAVTANGTAFVYPQNHVVDEATNIEYIVLSGSGGLGKNYIVCVNWTTGAYIRGFMAGTGYTTPVIDNDPTTGKKCLVLNGATDGTMEYYDISTLPAEMASPSPLATLTQREYLYKSLRKGIWLFCKFDTPVGTYRRVNHHVRALRSGTSFTTGQAVDFSLADVGDNNAYQTYMPHMQALTQGDGFLAASFGASFNTGDTVTPAKHWGVKIFPPSGGRPWVEALISPDVAMQKFIDSGYPATRVENEGIWVSSANKVYSLNILRSATGTVGDETTRGIIVLEEFAEGSDVIDFSAGAISGVHVDTVAPNVMKGASNVVTNPLTGATIATIDDLFDYMMALDIETKSFYTSTHAITGPGGAAFPTSCIVIARNGNNGTGVIEVIGSDVYQRYLVQGAAAPRTYTLSAIKMGVAAVGATATHELVLGVSGTSQISSRRPGTTTSTHHIFQNDNGTTGTIQTNGTATAYNVSSDELWKKFIGEYDANKAIAIIRADPVRDWNWDEERGSGYAIGWGAQTSYKVSTDLASPGGWFDPITEEEVSEDTVRWVSPFEAKPAAETDEFYVLTLALGSTDQNSAVPLHLLGRKGDGRIDVEIDGQAYVIEDKAGEVLPDNVVLMPAMKVEPLYRPWGVDQSKRTPYLWAAVGRLLDEVDALKAQVAALEAKQGA